MDVAVVGGGPAGLLAAARCAEAGLDVLVLEEDALVGSPTHCTGIVSLEIAELAKIPEEVVLERLTRARLWAPGGATLSLAWERGGAEQILAIDRGAFDQALAGQAIEAGAEIRCGARVSSLAVGRDGVEVTVGEECLRARACVLACGVSYGLQRGLGLGLPGRVLHTAQVEVDAAPVGQVELYFGRKIAPEGFAWAVPVTRDGCDRMKVGVLARGDAGAALERVLARPEIRTRLAGAPGPPLRRLLPVRPIARTYADRLLVVGDAGGFTKPTTGGGIFYSLVTASLAAETLVEAFAAGRLDARWLARYEQRWQERLGGELFVGDWLRRLVARCSDAEIEALLGALASEDVQALIRGTARFNWHGRLILEALYRPGIGRLLLASLFR